MEEALQSTTCEGVIEWSVRRRVAGGLQSTSSEHTHFGPPTMSAGSTPRGSVVVRARCVAHPSKGIVASTSTFIGPHHAESSRARVLQSSAPLSPAADTNVVRATIPRRTSAHVVGGASFRQGPQTSGRTEKGGSTLQGRRGRGGAQRTRLHMECASQAEGGIEEEAEDIDEPFDK